MRIKEFLKKRWRNVAMIALLVCLIGSMAAPAMAQVVIVRPLLVVDDIPVDGATTDPVSSNWAYDHQTATNAPTGFPNRTDSILSFVAGTRTFSIAPSNGSFIYYITGMEYTVSSSDDIVIADTSGAHFIYYDGSTLSEAVNPSDATVEDIIENKAWVGTIYWNATDGAAYLLGDERHGTVLSGKTHHWLHDINGAAYDSGLTLSGYAEDTDSDAALTFELTDGQFYDEDVEHSITDGTPANQYEQQLNGGDAEITIVYKDDVDGSWKEDAATTLPYKTGGTGRLAYNKDDGDGTFSQVEVGDGKWVSMTLIATNDWQYPIKAIQGQNEYTDKKTAVEEATNEIISFGGGTLSPEVITLYRFVLRTKDTFGGTKKTKIEVDGVTDFRRTTVIGGAAVAIAHGALGGLANDDHAQYLLVADLENPPTENETDKAPTSEWAFDLNASFLDHSASHEDGGADEMNLDDLPGQPYEVFAFEGRSMNEWWKSMDSWTQVTANNGFDTNTVMRLEMQTSATLNGRIARHTGACRSAPQISGQRGFCTIWLNPAVSDCEIRFYIVHEDESFDPLDDDEEHGGIKIIDGDIYASVGDGVAEEAEDTGINLNAGGKITVEIRGIGTAMELYVNGSMVADLDGNLPATHLSNYCYAIEVKNTVAANRKVRINYARHTD